MFLVDDVILMPFRGILWILNEINHAAAQEMDDEADAITVQLSDLYMMLETGAITEEEFAAQEENLLNRIDQLERCKHADSNRQRKQ